MSKAAVRRADDAEREQRAVLDKMARIVLLDQSKCKPNFPAFDYLKKNANACGQHCIEVVADGKRIEIREDACPACLNRAKRCPNDAVRIVNLPHSFAKKCTFRFGLNGFKFHRLPVPRANQVLGLIGTNGIGKSTALRILAGTLKPTLNSAAGGVDWDETLAYFRGSELQTYFTRLLDEPMKTVTKPQFVDLLSRDLAGHSVRALLERVDGRGELERVVGLLDLRPILTRRVEHLSGGELQRLALAICIVQQAEVYLFDEPSSYLDVSQRLKAARAIRSCAGASTYVVCVEHDLALLDYVSDTCCLCYGVGGAYGIASASLGSREGVNAFLSGYLPSDNLRFRHEALNFKASYPSFSKRLGGFTLHVEGGSISAGEIVLLLGQNGCGKTCFVKMLAGKLAADETAAANGGGKPVDLPKLHVSYKPQHIGPSFGGTVKQLLEKHVADALGHERFVADVLSPLKLDGLMERRVATLSGGELQRVAIATCLGTPADVFLIDEPSAYLDSEQRIAVARMLKRFVQFTGATCLVVEHDFMLATYLADQVIVYDGTPAVEATARSPQPLHSGMNRFLEGLQVTFRRDPETHRPRINKLDSVTDREQKASGNYFYME